MLPLQVSAKLMAEKEGSPTDRKVLTLLSNCGHTRGVLVRLRDVPCPRYWAACTETCRAAH